MISKKESVKSWKILPKSERLRNDDCSLGSQGLDEEYLKLFLKACFNEQKKTTEENGLSVMLEKIKQSLVDHNCSWNTLTTSTHIPQAQNENLMFEEFSKESMRNGPSPEMKKIIELLDECVTGEVVAWSD